MMMVPTWMFRTCCISTPATVETTQTKSKTFQPSEKYADLGTELRGVRGVHGRASLSGRWWYA